MKQNSLNSLPTQDIVFMAMPASEWKETKNLINETRKLLMKLHEEREEELLTVAEVSKLLKVRTQTVESYIKAGKIPASRLEKKLIIKRSDLNHAISDNIL